MTNNEKFQNQYNEILEKVKNEILKVERGESNKSIKQLMTIITDLEHMNDVRNVKLFMPSFPRIVIDSWDYTDTLGIELINIVELYKKYFK